MNATTLQPLIRAQITRHFDLGYLSANPHRVSPEELPQLISLAANLEAERLAKSIDRLTSLGCAVTLPIR